MIVLFKQGNNARLLAPAAKTADDVDALYCIWTYVANWRCRHWHCCVLQVTVYTSKREGAGTDGAVYATLHGSQGLPITSAPAGSSTGTASPAQRQQQQPEKAASPSSAAAAAAAAAAGWRSSGRHELRGGRAGGLGEGSAVSVTLPSMRSLGQLRQLTLELESVTVRTPAKRRFTFYPRNGGWGVSIAVFLLQPGAACFGLVDSACVPHSLTHSRLLT